jgi:hypothetical protein
MTSYEDMKFGLPKVDTERPPYGFSTFGQTNSMLKYWRTPYTDEMNAVAKTRCSQSTQRPRRVYQQTPPMPAAQTNAP